jgi:beta-N-acetylhexosaminidase
MTSPVRSSRPRRRRRRPWWQRLRWDRLAIVVTPIVLLGVTVVSLGGSDVGTRAATTRTSTTTTTWRAGRTNCTDSKALDQHQKLAQLLMPALTSPSAAEVGALTQRSDRPGGLLFMSMQDGAERAAVAARLNAYPGLAAVDDEGGRVNRFGVASFPSARRQELSLSLQQIRALAKGRAKDLVSRGLNLDFAPVVDVSSEPDNGPIGDRSYSDDPQSVVRNAGAFADGLRDGGVLPALKHFPGHGSASGDSHAAIVTTPPLAQLERKDLIPYGALTHAGPVAVMVGHLDVAGLTEPGTPASLSPAAYRYLRKKLGFGGLAVTDDLGTMKAITARRSTVEAVVAALVAGADLAIIGPADSYDSVLARLDAASASGELATSRVDEALNRVRIAQGCPS